MPYPTFDRSQLKLLPLSERNHDVTLRDIHPQTRTTDFTDDAIPTLADRIKTAKENGRSVIVSFGAHVIKYGMSRFLIDLMERGLITHLATNGAGSIHDFELAKIGATSEDVGKYIKKGQFGLWKETGELNEIISKGAAEGRGYGEAVGMAIENGKFEHKEISIFAAAWRLKIPLTVHIGIGYDIIHEPPNADGAALGAASYRDFLTYTHSVQNLEGGVFLNFGSAVMGPEIYLKALSMARNVAEFEGKEICHFTTAVFDLFPLPKDVHTEPTKDNPFYYYRPFKTILCRTVADGGESFYGKGDHRDTITALRQELIK